MLVRAFCRKAAILMSLSMLVLAFGVQAAAAIQAVGVKAGDWIKYAYVFSAEIPSGTAFPEWMKVEFLTVDGTKATVRMTLHFSDGTEQDQTISGDIMTGPEFSGFIIPIGMTTGDSVYISGYGYVTFAGETRRVYAGVERLVIYASMSFYGTDVTYYWDKMTGVMVEASVNVSGITGAARATETNMWQAQAVTSGIKVSVKLSKQAIGIGEETTVNVTVTNVPPPGLYAYQLSIHYDKTLLNATSAQIPSDHFLKPSLSPDNIYIVDYGTIIQTEGYVCFALSLLADEPGKTGSGTLVTVTFVGLAPGNSIIDLPRSSIAYDLILVDGNTQQIEDYTVEPGSVTVGGQPPSSEWDYVYSDNYGRGTLLELNTKSSLFRFVAPDKDYGVRKATHMEIGKTISVGKYYLTSGQGNILIFMSHQDDELTLTAVALDRMDYCAAVADDTSARVRPYILIDDVGTETYSMQTSSLTLTSWLIDDTLVKNSLLTHQDWQSFMDQEYGMLSLRTTMVARALNITVTFKGDLNKDLKVNIQDIFVVAMAYGSKSGDGKWNATADLDKSGIIGILDVFAVAEDYGKTAFDPQFI